MHLRLKFDELRSRKFEETKFRVDGALSLGVLQHEIWSRLFAGIAQRGSI
jgi:hypothetical protein